MSSLRTKLQSVRHPKALIAGLVVLALILVAAASGFVADASYRGKALPGATLAGQTVGGMSATELRSVVSEQTRNLGIDLTLAGTTLHAKASDLGVRVDSAATVRAVTSRGGWWIYRNLDKNYQLQLEVDRTAVHTWIYTNFPEITQAPIEASVVFDAETNQFLVTPGAAGVGVAEDGLAAIAEELAAHASGAALSLEVGPIEPDSDEATAQAACDWANQRLSPVWLTYGGEVLYTLSAAEIAGVISFTPDKDGAVQPGVDASKVQKLLDLTVADAVNVAAKDEQVRTEANGAQTVLVAGQNGRTLTDTADTAQTIANALTNASDDTIELSFDEVTYSTVSTSGSWPHNTPVGGTAQAQVDYLLKHAFDYNVIDWGNYAAGGGDCVNFTSQGLYVRGVPMDGTWYSRGVGAAATAWVYVPAMDSWMASKGWTRLSMDQLSQVKVGDVGVFDWDSNGGPNHIMTVSKIEQGPSGPILYFVSHTTDGTYRELMQVITVEHPNSTAWFYSVP